MNPLLSLALAILPAFAWASSFELGDPWQAGTDGPLVFYRGPEIVVKYVVVRDTAARVKILKFSSKSEVSLTCQVPESGDSFTFMLRDDYRDEETFYPAPAKLLALSDIEGNFSALKTMLLGAKVMDKQFRWTFGAGHLVLVGDFFDRGLNVTECLWLIYKLEGEAAAAGGKVHFILGNHELLNLQGNTTYVRKKYLANAALLGEEYKFWYDRHSELGRWLRTKNAVERIGDIVYCHGGISPALAATKLSLPDINRISRQNLGKPNEAISDSLAKAVFDPRTGIFWYRGAAKSLASPDDITAVLRYAGAKRMVIGHTMHPDVTALYGGKVICIDLYHEENLRQGFMKTLWVEDGLCYVLDSRGVKTTVFSVNFPPRDD
jgi:Calcineurin-like phosphoesterase.